MNNENKSNLEQKIINNFLWPPSPLNPKSSCTSRNDTSHNYTVWDFDHEIHHQRWWYYCDWFQITKNCKEIQVNHYILSKKLPHLKFRKNDKLFMNKIQLHLSWLMSLKFKVNQEIGNIFLSDIMNITTHWMKKFPRKVQSNSFMCIPLMIWTQYNFEKSLRKALDRMSHSKEARK